MELDSKFYHDLFATLSEQAKPQPPGVGQEGFLELKELMKRLQEDSSARHIFIIESTGKESISYGDLGNINITDLTVLVVGKMLACKALAELINGRPIL